MQQKKFKEAKDYFKLLPIGIILLIVPVIVYLKEVKLDAVVATYWKGSTKEIDFFSYYKVVWFIALTCISVLFFFFYISTKKIKLTFPKIFFPLVIYLGFVFMSSTFSKFHDVAFFGFPDRYEGFFTILCYILVCFLCAVLINSKFDIKYVFSFLAVSVLVVSIIGFTQFFGFDFLQTDFGKSLMLPMTNKNLADALTFNFPEKFIYSTLYNPNYVGGFFSMILPICLVIFISTRDIYHKILSGIFCILSFINLLGSRSTAGYFCLIFSSIVLIIFLRKNLKRNLLPLIAIVICFVLSTVVMNYTSGGIIFNELGISKHLAYNIKIPALKKKSQNAITPVVENPPSPTLLNLSADSNTTNDALFKTLDMQNILITTNSNAAKVDTPTPLNLSNNSSTSPIITDIRIDKFNLSLFVSNSDALVVKYDSASTSLLFYDNTNKTINLTTKSIDEKAVVYFDDIRFKNFTVSIKNNLVFVDATNIRINLIITKDGFKFITPSGQLTEGVNAESFGFKGREMWASARGYIWSRSIPLIKNTILLGHGPDTYAMYFPQNDYAAKLNYLSNINTIVDKPHNIYLQIAINTGLLSLMAFLVFVGWYCIASVKLYFKGLYNQYFAPGIACFIAVISFLFSSLSNDSTISVSPVFWIILGVGIACNRLYSKETLHTSNAK